MAGRARRRAGRRGRLSDPGVRGRTLLVLGGGPAQRHTVATARGDRLGARAVVLDAEPGRGDEAVSSEDEAGVLAAARRHGADGLIAPGTDWPVRVAARVAAALDLPHPVSPATAEACTDKLLQRARLDRAGVPQPAWSADGPPRYPCVVKPPDRQGQRGLSFVAAQAGLAAAVAHARSASRDGRVLFEEDVPGREVTVNGFAVGGRVHTVAVTDREHFPDARGVAWRHVHPALPGAEAAAPAAEAAAAALGIADGPVYVQLILAPDGPRVVEVAARLGGGHDPELALATVGVDLAAAAVRAALGAPVDPAALVARPRAAGVVEFLRAPPGRLAAARAPAPAVLYDRPGHVYGTLVTGPDRAGFVLAVGSTREGALAAARRTVEAVAFDVT